MTIPVPVNGYAISVGTAPNIGMAPIIATFSPSESNVVGPSGPFKIGQLWVNTELEDSFQLVAITSSNGVVKTVWNALATKAEVVLDPNSVVGTDAVSNLVSIPSGLAGEVLTSNGAALPSFQPFTPSGSIVGTANQIAVTTLGATNTLSLTNGISLGTDQPTSPPVGGILMPGMMSMGNSISDGRAELYVDSSGATYGIWLTGTQTASDASQNMIGLFVNDTFSPPGSLIGTMYSVLSEPLFNVAVGQTVAFAIGVYSNPDVTSNLGTISNLYGIYQGTVTGAGGVITNAYGGFFNHPSVGTNSVALYTDDASIGFAGVTPPALGAIISGQVSIGSSSPDPRAKLFIDNTNFAYGVWLQGTISALDSSNNAFGYFGRTIFAPTASASFVVEVDSVPRFAAAAGQTILNACSFYATNSVTANLGTITNLVGYYSDNDSAPAGVITNAYGAVLKHPVPGANNCALYADDMSIGFLSTTPPMNGAFIAGQVGIGAAAVDTNGLVQITATNPHSLTLIGTKTGHDASFNQVVLNMALLSNPSVSISGAFVSSAVTNHLNAIGITTTNSYGYYSDLLFSSLAGDVTNAYGVFADSGSAVGAGTVTNGYGGFFKQPLFGSVASMALYADNVSIGFSTTSPPTNGALILGQVGIGSASLDADALVTVTSSNAHTMSLVGLKNGSDASFQQITMNMLTICAPSVSIDASYLCRGEVEHLSSPVVSCTDSFLYYSNFNFASLGGSVANAYNFFSDTGTSSGVGTVSNGYGGFFKQPLFGSVVSTALYTDNLVIGTPAVNPPLNGLSVINGTSNFKIFTTTPAAANAVTTSFGSVVLGTIVQNTLGYDMIVNLSIAVSSATAATIIFGISSVSPPTTVTQVPSFTVATTTIFNFSYYLPNGYFLLVNTTGTITVASVTTTATGV